MDGRSFRGVVTFLSLRQSRITNLDLQRPCDFPFADDLAPDCAVGKCQNGVMAELIRILQTSVAPVVMVSGVGLLILSMTNRFSQTTARTRALTAQIREAGAIEKRYLTDEIRILYRRARFLLAATVLSLISVFLVSLLIATLFVAHIAAAELPTIISGLFIASVGCLAVSLLFFIADMTLALSALKRELQGNDLI
jgi:hypothetical protein